MPQAYFKPQSNTIGCDLPCRFSLFNSTGVLPGMLQVRFLQEQQIADLRKNPSYQSAMYLNQDSLQELNWWFNNLEICNGKLIVSLISKTLIQSDASKKGLGAYCKCQKRVRLQNKEILVISKDIWEFAMNKEIILTAEYLQGRLNVRAEWASRNFRDSSKWLLSPRLF